MGHAYGVKNFQQQKRLRSTASLDGAIQNRQDKLNKRAFKSAIKKRIADNPEFAALVAETKKKTKAAREAKRLAREKALRLKAAQKAKRSEKKAVRRAARLAKPDQKSN